MLGLLHGEIMHISNMVDDLIVSMHTLRHLFFKAWGFTQGKNTLILRRWPHFSLISRWDAACFLDLNIQIERNTNNY